MMLRAFLAPFTHTKRNYISQNDFQKMLDQGRRLFHAEGKVYDLTGLENHPGGMDVLSRKVSQDVTYDKSMHASNGRSWQKYCIGFLKV